MAVYLKIIELVIADHLTEFIVILKSIVNSLSVIFFFRGFRVIPYCLRFLTFVHSLTNSLTTRGLEKLPENFSQHL